MAARMVNATPTANANLAGFGAICSPHGFQYPGTSTRPSTSCRTFRGPNRGRCVNCFTLRIIVILMEIVKDLYISTLGERVPVRDSGPQLRTGKRLSSHPPDPPAGGCRMGWNQFKKLKTKEKKEKISFFSFSLLEAKPLRLKNLRFLASSAQQPRH